jgi:uncharacterized membrane protein YhaH (DUF805 family)
MGPGKYNGSKFVFSELFSNTNGKTSGSGFAGVMLFMVGGISFFAAMVGYFMQIPNTLEVMGKIVIILSLSAALLGVRKFVGTPTSITTGENTDNSNHDNDHHDIDPILESKKP